MTFECSLSLIAWRFWITEIFNILEGLNLLSRLSCLALRCLTHYHKQLNYILAGAITSKWNIFCLSSTSFVSLARSCGGHLKLEFKQSGHFDCALLCFFAPDENERSAFFTCVAGKCLRILHLPSQLLCSNLLCLTPWFPRKFTMT